MLLWASQQAQAREVLHERFRSERLGRDVSYTVHLPDAPSSARRSSTLIYLLHGAGGNESDWLRDGKLASPLAMPMLKGSNPLPILLMPSLGPDTW